MHHLGKLFRPYILRKSKHRKTFKTFSARTAMSKDPNKRRRETDLNTSAKSPIGKKGKSVISPVPRTRLQLRSASTDTRIISPTPDYSTGDEQLNVVIEVSEDEEEVYLSHPTVEIPSEEEVLKRIEESRRFRAEQARKDAEEASTSYKDRVNQAEAKRNEQARIASEEIERLEEIRQKGITLERHRAELEQQAELEEIEAQRARAEAEATVAENGEAELSAESESESEPESVPESEPESEPELEANMDTIPIAELIALVQEYSGAQAELNGYLRATDRLWARAVDHSVNEKIRLAIAIQAKLKARAAEAIAEIETDDWPAIKTALIQKVRPNISTDLALLTLTKATQDEKETVTEFGHRILKLRDTLNLAYDPQLENATKAFIIAENDKRARRTFEDGLRDKRLQNRVITANRVNLQATIDYAIEQEIRIGESVPRKPEVVCNYCQIRGHRESDCRKRFLSPDGAPQERDDQPRRRVVTCFKCGRLGHYANECWSSDNDDYQQNFNQNSNGNGNNSEGNNNNGNFNGNNGNSNGYYNNGWQQRGGNGGSADRNASYGQNANGYQNNNQNNIRVIRSEQENGQISANFIRQQNQGN